MSLVMNTCYILRKLHTQTGIIFCIYEFKSKQVPFVKAKAL